jgi:serine/threonine-protein kinase
VALRQLPAALLAAPNASQGLLADLKAAAGVTHPNLARVMGFVEIEGQKYVVSELVPGRTFAEALSAGKRLATPQILSLAKVLAQALGAIHAKKQAHGSLQPSNVMVAQGVVKLVDFGLGRLVQTAKRPNDYRAPEGQLDAAGDLYALAGVLYHLLTGVHPKAQAPLTAASKLVPGVPAALDQLLFQNLQAVPQARSASAEQFLQILAKVTTGA